jgi:site-specific DNA-methyltransferase (adenine-specific)
MINLYNMDCMEAMKDMADNQYDLAIVDPPYGIGASKGVGKHSRKKYEKANKDWDSKVPSTEYWNELFRVTKNQIVCGANYFLEHLYSNKSFVCWVKNNPAPNFAEAELIWTSLSINAKVFDTKKQIQHQIMWEGGSIHPTQKPIQLYEWILMTYAKEGDKILDTHLGSGSIAIACHNLGYDLDAYEIDKEYYEATLKRFNNHTTQTQLWT